jgi:hypothetical protein
MVSNGVPESGFACRRSSEFTRYLANWNDLVIVCEV